VPGTYSKIKIARGIKFGFTSWDKSIIQLMVLIGFFWASFLSKGLSFGESTISNSVIISIQSTSPKSKLDINKNRLARTIQNDSLKIVKGILQGEFNEILIGGTINIKDTENGVISGIDGKFTIDITNEFAYKDSVTLVFLYVGYESEEKLVTKLNFNEKDEIFLGITFENSLKLDGYKQSIFKRLVLGLKRIFT